MITYKYTIAHLIRVNVLSIQLAAYILRQSNDFNLLILMSENGYGDETRTPKLSGRCPAILNCPVYKNAVNHLPGRNSCIFGLWYSFKTSCLVLSFVTPCRAHAKSKTELIW